MNERAQRLFLILGALLLTLGVGLALKQARLQGALSLSPAIAPPLAAQVALRFREVTVTGYEQGKPAWNIAAPVIETERDRRTMRFSGGLKATLLQNGKPGAYLTSPSARFTDQSKLDFTGGLEATLLQDGKQRALLSAPSALFDTKTRAFLATGAITVKILPPAQASQSELPGARGTITLTCTELRYEVGTKLVTCPGAIILVTEKGDEVFGRALSLNLETRSFSLSDFRGRLRATQDEQDELL